MELAPPAMGNTRAIVSSFVPVFGCKFFIFLGPWLIMRTFVLGWGWDEIQMTRT